MNSIAIINANVIPMENGARAEAIYIKDGVIAAVGGSEEIKALCARDGVTPLDAGGATVLPGLYDCHTHALMTGEHAMAVDLFDCADIPALVSALADAAAGLPEGRMVFGKRLDESRLAEKRPPLMKELDAIDRPVFIADRGGHYKQVNRAAFEALGVPEDMNGVRRDDSGELTGRLQDDANFFAEHAFFSSWSDEQLKDAMRFTAQMAVKCGITSLTTMEGMDSDPRELELIQAVAPELPVDLLISWNGKDVETAVSHGLKLRGGDILLDGSIGSRTAAFSEKYCDGDTAGYLNYTDTQVYDFVLSALENELTISFHVIGELGIKQALDAIEKVLADRPELKETARLRLDHFGFPSQADIDRAGALGLRISTQPGFTYLRGGPGTVYRARLGEERERGGYPSRRLLDAGCILGGGSDSDITPMDSVFGIHAAVNQPYPENAVTPYEAVRMYTIDAARLSFEDEKKGSLAPGKQGDIVILSADPMTVDPRTIKDIKVLETIRKGEVVYEA